MSHGTHSPRIVPIVAMALAVAIAGVGVALFVTAESKRSRPVPAQSSPLAVQSAIPAGKSGRAD